MPVTDGPPGPRAVAGDLLHRVRRRARQAAGDQGARASSPSQRGAFACIPSKAHAASGASRRPPGWRSAASARRPARPAGCPRPCRPSPRAWRGWPRRCAGTTSRLGASSSGWSAGSGSGSVTSSAGAGDPALAAARARARRVVDDRAAGGVHQVRLGLHRAQLALADQPARLVGERAVERHDVGLRQQRLERVAAAAPSITRAPKPSHPPRPPPCRSAPAPRSAPSSGAGRGPAASPAPR